MANLDKIDNLYADLEFIQDFTKRTHQYFFYFVAPGEDIFLSYRYPIGFCTDFEKDLKNVRSLISRDLPDGSYAVFIYDTHDNTFTYYKTIKHRRKNFDLSCDSK